MVTEASMVYGLIILFISSAFCSSGGVGGGSLNVPIFYSIVGFSYDKSVILSMCTLIGNHGMQALINMDKRHPSSPTTPIIYWDALLIILPSILGGSNFGVIVVKAIPDSMIYILAMVVLVIAVYLTAKKGLRLYAIETQLIQEEENDAKGGSYKAHDVSSPLREESTLREELNEPTIIKHVGKKAAPKVNLSSIFPPYLCCYYSLCDRLGICSDKTRRAGQGGSLHHALTSEEEEQGGEGSSTEPVLPPIEFPWAVIGVIAAVFAMYVACYVIQKQYDQCTQSSYILLAVIYVLLIAQVSWGLRYLIKQYEGKINTAWDSDTPTHNNGLVDGEIHWGLQSAVVPVVSFLIGVTSALLGIGGGELMGPFLLVFKVLPPVSTATTSFMSLLNTSASVAHYLVLGELPFGYGAAVCGVGALGGVTGRVLALYFVANYRRASVLILSLVGVLSCSIFIYLYYLIDSDQDYSLSSICS